MERSHATIEERSLSLRQVHYKKSRKTWAASTLRKMLSLWCWCSLLSLSLQMSLSNQKKTTTNQIMFQKSCFLFLCYAFCLFPHLCLYLFKWPNCNLHLCTLFPDKSQGHLFSQKILQGQYLFLKSCIRSKCQFQINGDIPIITHKFWETT